MPEKDVFDHYQKALSWIWLLVTRDAEEWDRYLDLVKMLRCVRLAVAAQVFACALRFCTCMCSAVLHMFAGCTCLHFGFFGLTRCSQRAQRRRRRWRGEPARRRAQEPQAADQPRPIGREDRLRRLGQEPLQRLEQVGTQHCCGAFSCASKAVHACLGALLHCCTPSLFPGCLAALLPCYTAARDAPLLHRPAAVLIKRSHLTPHPQQAVSIYKNLKKGRNGFYLDEDWSKAAQTFRFYTVARRVAVDAAQTMGAAKLADMQRTIAGVPNSAGSYKAKMKFLKDLSGAVRASVACCTRH